MTDNSRRANREVAEKLDKRREPSISKEFKVSKQDMDKIDAIQKTPGLGRELMLDTKIDMFEKWLRAQAMVYHGTDGRYILTDKQIQVNQTKEVEYKDALVRASKFSTDDQITQAWNQFYTAYRDDGKKLPGSAQRTLSTMKTLAKEKYSIQQDLDWGEGSATVYSAAESTTSAQMQISRGDRSGKDPVAESAVQQRREETRASWDRVLARDPGMRARQGNLSIEDFIKQEITRTYGERVSQWFKLSSEKTPQRDVEALVSEKTPQRDVEALGSDEGRTQENVSDKIRRLTIDDIVENPNKVIEKELGYIGVMHLERTLDTLKKQGRKANPQEVMMEVYKGTIVDVGQMLVEKEKELINSGMEENKVNRRIDQARAAVDGYMRDHSKDGPLSAWIRKETPKWHQVGTNLQKGIMGIQGTGVAIAFTNTIGIAIVLHQIWNKFKKEGDSEPAT